MNEEDTRWIQSIDEADISDTTKSQYIRNLATLKKLANGRALRDVITHPGAMKRRIESAYTSLQTRKAMMASIKALLKYNPEVADELADHVEHWNLMFRTTDRAIQERVATAEPTEREILNWVPWPDVLAKERELAATKYGSIDHLLLAMYCLIEPIRADFGHVRLVTDAGMLDTIKHENFMYLSRKSGESQLVLHTYKTSKKYGRFQRTLPDPLVRVIIASLQDFPRPYLFVNDVGNPYDKKNSFVRFVNRALARLFGKNLTISLLRHSFISNIDFNTSTPAKLFKHSRHMMHGIGQQQLYRRHIPAMKIERVSPESTTSSSSSTPPTKDVTTNDEGRVMYI